jgi:dynein heavy chain
VKAVAQAFDVPNATVEECMRDHSTQALLTGFFGGEPTGATRIIFYKQKRDRFTEEGEVYDNGGPEELFVTSGDGDRLKERGIYFVRVCDKAVGAATVDTDLNCGVIEGLPVANMKALVGEVYSPLLNAGFSGWDKRMTAEAKDDLYGVIDRFSTLLGAVVESLANGLELKKPNAGITIENKPAAIAKAAADTRYVSAYEEIVEDWCNQVDRLLAETDDNRNEPDDAGPSTELEYWRSRMGKFNSITEQLKQPACKTLLAVLQMAKARVMKRWRTLDNTITDATNEAKDNVKYLSTLEKYIEPLYAGDPLTIIDALPGLLNNTRMMLTIARYYSTRERMTLLFRKVTNQMIANCREHVTAGGVLWSQPTHSLIGRLQACITLNEAYQEQYHQTRERLEQTPSGKQFDFDVNRIFGKFDLFQRRVEKLVDMFNTFDQVRQRLPRCPLPAALPES